LSTIRRWDLFSRAGDDARFAQVLLSGGELEGVRILTQMTIALMTSDQFPSTTLRNRRLGLYPGGKTRLWTKADSLRYFDEHSASGADGQLRWLGGLQNVPSGDVCELEQDANGECSDRSGCAPGGDPSRFDQTKPAGHFQEAGHTFVYGTKRKQRYFETVGDDYFPLGAPKGM
jgi:hypothetical protein